MIENFKLLHHHPSKIDMSFSEFKDIPQVQQKYDIKYKEDDFIVCQPHPVPGEFQEEFDFNQKHLDTFASEGARCEAIIFPILREIYKKYVQKLALWVQKPLSVDSELTGIPDYMISKKSEYGKLYLEPPVLAVVEAKKNDFEQGWGQCLAELIAAQKLNESDSRSVYGIVTDGKLWEVGKLEKKTFTKNKRSFTIDDLADLFSFLDYVFTQIDHQLV